MGRKKKLILNTVTSLMFQITSIVCGFVLPRLILSNYGSEVNGLVNSITQFLAIIGFLDLGVGAVVQSSLYKPLAENDNNTTSCIISSAQNFFHRIAAILSVYIIFLCVFYSLLSNSEFDFKYISTLIIAMGINSFSQYYFGVVDRLLLNADQKGYIQYVTSAAILIINTALCAILIKAGAGIQIIKLVTSLLFLIRPLVFRIYIKRNYCIDRKIKYEGEPIKQKWNGVAQHVAAVVLDGTDVIVLTLLSTLSNVSIYSVYHLVVSGVKTMFTVMTNGIQSLLGELWAKKEMETLRSTFNWAEWAIHTGATFIFGCTASLIVPFVQVYTRGVTDTDYFVPFFGLLITLANALHCLRLPYNIMILAAGHYKQTQHNYIIAAILNIIISVLTVNSLGLIGVAIGTIIAMFYQTIWMANYDCKAILHQSISHFVKRMLIDIIVFIISFLACLSFKLRCVNYWNWFILAVKTMIIWAVTTFVVNYFAYGNYLKRLSDVMMFKKSRK